MNTWRNVLLRAASIVDRGWCQGSAHLNRNGHVCGRREAVQSCAIGALGRAAHDNTFLTLEAGRGLRDYLDVDSLSEWNDEPWRTASEVAEMMRQAATREGDGT